MMMAKAGSPRPAVLMDYALLTSTTNMTFQSDTTYYVSGNVSIERHQ